MGSRILDQTKAATKAAQSGVYTHTLPNQGQGPSPAQMTQAFPRGGLTRMSGRDELMKEKMEFMDKDGMTPFGQVHATDADFEWLRRKRETEAEANLDAWVGTNFHTGDVTTAKWLSEIYPHYYEVREREIMDRAKFALRVKLLLLRGPKNPKDLILLWGLQTGQIELDRDWDRVGPSTKSPTMSDEQKRFKKGLFNPLKYLSDDERKTNETAYGNPFAPATLGAGGGQLPTRPFYGGAVPDKERYPKFLEAILAGNK